MLALFSFLSGLYKCGCFFGSILHFLYFLNLPPSLVAVSLLLWEGQKIEWSDGTGGTVAACFGFSWLWLSCPYSHTKYKQTLKMEPVNTHTNTHIYTVWRLGEESGCQNWRLAERCEMLWHFTSLHFPRLLWMLQQRCQPKRRPVWNIPCTHTHPQSLHACTFTPRHMNYSDSFALFIFHVVVWFLEMSTRQVSGSLSSIPPDAQRKVW